MADACTEGLDTGFVALGYAKVAVLGIVQGITELLPISSTAHMRIVPAAARLAGPGFGLFGGDADGFARRRGQLFLERCARPRRRLPRAVGRRDFDDWSFRFTIWIVLATIPIGIAGLALANVLNACNSPLRGLPVIGGACLVMAALLALAEIMARHKRTIDNVSLVDAMVVGFAQIGALIPGVSRSGSTLTAALFLGLRRDEAARFSFLLGVPAIALAGLKEVYELYKAHLGAYGWSVLAVGLVVASISAFFAIWGLLRVLERFSAWPFVAYRFLLGIVLIAGAAVGWLT